MAKRWQNNLIIAATAALTFGGQQALAQDDANTAAPAVATEQTLGYPAINPALLDDGIAHDPVAQKRIIDEAAVNRPIADPRFDAYGLTRDAAYALTAMRNNGDLPGAKPGQSAGDWWREAEPKITERMQEATLGNYVGYGILALGVLGMGAALARGNITGLEGGGQRPGGPKTPVGSNNALATRRRGLTP